MKIVALTAGLLFYATAGHAAGPSTDHAALARYLSANAAVRGAGAEARRYSGAGACGPLRVVEMELDTFRAVVDCGKADSGKSTVLGDGASASVEVTGSFYNGGPGVLIERIEFHYGG